MKKALIIFLTIFLVSVFFVSAFTIDLVESFKKVYGITGYATSSQDTPLSLSSYPAPFVTDGALETIIVISGSEENIAAFQIFASLSNEVTKEIPITTTKLASEVTPQDYANKNIILIGGPVSNPLTKTTLEAANIDTNKEVGMLSLKKSIIRLVKMSSGKAALIVEGYEIMDTRRAGKAVAEYKNYADKFRGAALEVKGTELEISDIVPISSCIDSDGGINYEDKGVCTEYRGDKTIELPDICKSAKVQEAYCSEQGTCRYKEELYVCPGNKFCSAGKCVVGCEETDDGRNIYQQGECYQAGVLEGKDSCARGQLTEWYCVGGTKGICMSVQEKCSEGCSRGACAGTFECSDPDRENVNVKSTCEDSGTFFSQAASPYTDSCYTSRAGNEYVLEYVCSANQCSPKYIRCEQGCENGVCKTEIAKTEEEPDVTASSKPKVTMEPSECAVLCEKAYGEIFKITAKATSGKGVDTLYLRIAGEQPKAKDFEYKCDGAKSCSNSWDIKLDFVGTDPQSADWSFWAIANDISGQWSEYANLGVNVHKIGTTSCTDSDGGKNLYVKGTATAILETGGTTNATDACCTPDTCTPYTDESKTKIFEAYCRGGTLVVSNFTYCPSESYCKDGACCEKTEAAETNCADGKDNDCDEKTDCDDPDCGDCPVVTPAACVGPSSSDINPFLREKCIDNEGTEYTDKCFIGSFTGKQFSKDFFCESNNKCVPTYTTCPAGCKDGKCIRAVQIGNCFSTDGTETNVGMDKYVKGICSVHDSIDEESCHRGESGKWYVKEYYCRDDLCKNIYIQCDNRCDNGACIK